MEKNAPKTFPLIHFFLTALLTFAVLQFNWMAERENYKDAVYRMGAAPAAALILCLLYWFFFKGLLRLLAVDFQDYLSKIKSFFPLLYVNILLVFSPQVTENVLFFECVLFVIVHLFALSQFKHGSPAEKICLFLTFLLLSIVFSECTLRACDRVRPSFIFASRSYDRFRMKPHSYHFDFRVNAGGFNDAEFSPDKRAGVFRVIGLGDSFLFGLLPYRYNFFTLLEEKLKAAGKSIELYNMGIPGMSIDDYYNLMVQEALPLKPDLIICHVFIQNDFKNYYASFSYSTNNLFHFKEWYLYRLMEYVFRLRTQFKGRTMRGRVAYNDNAGSFSHDTYLQMKWDRYEIFDGKMDIHTWYQSSAEILAKMQALLAKKGIGFLVVLIPDDIQINPALQREFEAFIRKTNRATEAGHAPAFDYGLPQKNIKKYLEAARIKYIDLLPAFAEEAEKGARLYIPDDGHWNIAGNKLAAETLYAAFLKNIKMR